MKTRLLQIVALEWLLFIIAGCNSEKTQPIEMISVPQLEFISDKSVGKNSLEKIQISLESFYISNEITNKEYREFTDWAKKNSKTISLIKNTMTILLLECQKMGQSIFASGRQISKT